MSGIEPVTPARTSKPHHQAPSSIRPSGIRRVLPRRKPYRFVAAAWCNLVRFGAKFGGALNSRRSSLMPRLKSPKRFTISLDAGDYDALRKLAEAQRPPLPLQYVVRLAVRRFLEQPGGMLLNSAANESR